MTSALVLVCDVKRVVRLRVLKGDCGMLLRCHEVRATHHKEALMPLNGRCVRVCVSENGVIGEGLLRVADS